MSRSKITVESLAVKLTKRTKFSLQYSVSLYVCCGLSLGGSHVSALSVRPVTLQNPLPIRTV